jgi:DNA-binding GntR family transcriptional regulator
MDPTDDTAVGESRQPAGAQEGLSPAVPELRQVRPGIVTAADAAASSIRDAVLQGLLQPGSRVTTADLAAGLGVSRQPVREALRKLEAEGYIERGGGRSHVVRRFSEAEMKENYYLRHLLESEVAFLAASRIDDAGLAELREINNNFKLAIDTGNTLKTMTLNTDFHRKLRESIGMPIMASIIDQLWVAQSLNGPFVVPERGLKPHEEHEAVLAALFAHDADAARAAMAQHVTRGASDTMMLRMASEKRDQTDSD